MIQSQIYIGQGLGLNTLGGIHYQNRTFAGGQTAAHLIIEIYMTRSINQIECIFFPVFCLVDNPDGLGLDGYASFPFKLHIVQNLILHLTLGEKSGLLNDSVCQGRLAVIYVCDDTKIPDFTLICSSH